MISLRPSGFDELGLRRALSDRMLPLMVAAMAFLAALALAGWFGSAALSNRWQQGAGSSLTVQVPQPTERALRGDQTRLAAVLAMLTTTPGVRTAHALSDEELTDLLKPWIGKGIDRVAISIPAVIAVQLTGADVATESLSGRLAGVAPGTLVEDHGVWIKRLAALARRLQACAALAVLLVAGVATAVIAIATRAGLSTRREAIEIVHGLGATDSYIAGRFAARATLLAAVGGMLGALLAVPVLVALATLTAPFGGKMAAETLPDALAALPVALWLALPCLPMTAAGIGFVTAHMAVRRWLRHLP